MQEPVETPTEEVETEVGPPPAIPDPPDPEQELRALVPIAEVALEEADAFEVTDAETFERAGIMVVGLRDALAEVDQKAERVLKPLRVAKQEMDALKREAREPYLSAISLLEGKATRHRIAVEAEARRKEQEERERREAEAEAARKAALEEAQAEGDDEKAERIEERLDAPVAAPPVARDHVAKAAPKTTGQRVTKKWVVEPVGGDMEEATRVLCAAIGRGEFGVPYVEVLMPKLRKFAMDNAGVLPIPGFTMDHRSDVSFTRGK
jgi:hypothetical protein